ncbi:MAG: TIGR00645 family protein [Micromonosporaceae bacterium]
MARRAAGFVGHTMFLSRWLQAPLYLGLIVVQAVYAWRFGVELWHLAHEVFAPEPGHVLTESQVVIAVLGLIDIVMIANLLIMIIVGGYETFVSRIDLDGHPDRPDWLSHVNANVLKVKLAMAIIGISSIHLLKTFIQAGSIGQKSSELAQQPPTVEAVMWQTIIHTAFLVSALVLAMIDRMMAHHQSHPAETPTDAPVSPAPTAARQPDPDNHGSGDNHRSTEPSHTG